MPTDENVQQRTVTELLQILETDGTYQGMTDAEIQSIVDYKQEVSYATGRTDGLNENVSTLHNQFSNSIRATTTSALQQQTAMIESILEIASNPQLQVIQYG